MKREELELFRKYLQGRTSQEETRFVRNLLLRSEGDEDIKQLLKEEWIRTSEENEFAIDMEDAWNEFKQKAVGLKGQEKKSKRNIPRRFPLRISPTLVAAAVFIILISTIVFVHHQSPQDISIREDISYTVKKTNRGEKLNISLPDGSFIKLNSSTQLRIPSDYNTTDERIVYLEGEAFFEVAKFDSKPFKVISGNVTTEVLGTSFNVNTFSDSEGVSVAVVKGRVRVANDNNEIILHPEEMTTVGPGTTTFTKRNFDLDFITGWRNNLLIFDKVSFEEVIERLKQWYGVEFVIEGKPKHAGKYSGRFENKSLQLVLEGLGFSSAFEYKIVDKTVYLKFK